MCLQIFASCVLIFLVFIPGKENSLLSRFRNPNEFLASKEDVDLAPEDLTDNLYTDDVNEVPDMNAPYWKRVRNRDHVDIIPYLKEKLSRGDDGVEYEGPLDADDDDDLDVDPPGRLAHHQPLLPMLANGSLDLKAFPPEVARRLPPPRPDGSLDLTALLPEVGRRPPRLRPNGSLAPTAAPPEASSRLPPLLLLPNGSLDLSAFLSESASNLHLPSLLPNASLGPTTIPAEAARRLVLLPNGSLDLSAIPPELLNSARRWSIFPGVDEILKIAGWALLNKWKYTGEYRAQCYWCGLNYGYGGDGIPKSPICHDMFNSEDFRARTQARRYMAKCYFNPILNNWIVKKFNLGPSEPWYYRWNERYWWNSETHVFRSSGLKTEFFGYYIRGCFKRWTDVGKVYTQRGCRAHPPLKGTTLTGNRFRRLELMLRWKRDACVHSPHASLTPFARGISLFVRYHICVCSQKFCNHAAPSLQPSLHNTFLIIMLLNVLFV